MITVKQVLEKYSLVLDNSSDEELKLSVLSEAGIIDSTKLPMIRRSLNKNINEMTEAERKTLKSLLETLMDHTLLDENKKMDYPSDKEMPVVIILKRKAIRVYPDNQKVGLYYSQALDRYISIPFGKGAKDLSPQMNEALISVKSPAVQRDIEQREKQTAPDFTKPRTIRTRTNRLPASAVERLKKNNPKLYNSALDSQERRQDKEVQRTAIRSMDSTGLAQANVRKRDIVKSAFGGNAPVSHKVGAAVGSVVGMVMAKRKLQKAAQTVKEQRLDEVGPAAVPLAVGAARAAQVVTKVVRAKRATKAAADATKTAKPKVPPKPKTKAKPNKPKPDKPTKAKKGTLSLDKDSDTSSDNKSSDPLFNPTQADHQFSSAGRAAPAIGVAQAIVPGAASTDAQRRAWGQMAVSQQYQQRPLQEMKRMVDENISNQKIQINEDSISINKSIAKKILKLHESLNDDNKKKLEKMLSEDVVSFRKAINFVLKQ